MRPLEAAWYLLLVLLVAQRLPESSCMDNDNYRYRHFLSQHYDNPKSSFSGKYCNAIMSKRDLTRPECKDTNTFIHGTKKKIKAVCTDGGVPYGDQQRSKNYFRVTTCTLQGIPTHHPCKYRENTTPRYIVIGCDGDWPVHYDESQIVTTV
ncbi:angiogenin-like [Hemicordylus capensis]|uniref:angiogenin-like n=1 Tax=Hemicordylus capensis TaxID=884348 RepID=UPI0023044031|nr:angiogenin-like [Hemicordylus capensis]